jgi:hypothetical protein
VIKITDHAVLRLQARSYTFDRIGVEAGHLRWMVRPAQVRLAADRAAPVLDDGARHKRPVQRPVCGGIGEQMAKATRATTDLNDAGVSYSVHVYAYNPDADRIGMQAAQHLGMPSATVLLEASALEHDAVFMNGDQRTLRVHLDPNDARAILKAHATAVVAESLGDERSLLAPQG